MVEGKGGEGDMLGGDGLGEERKMRGYDMGDAGIGGGGVCVREENNGIGVGGEVEGWEREGVR